RVASAQGDPSAALGGLLDGGLLSVDRRCERQAGGGRVSDLLPCRELLGAHADEQQLDVEALGGREHGSDATDQDAAPRARRANDQYPRATAEWWQRGQRGIVAERQGLGREVDFDLVDPRADDRLLGGDAVDRVDADQRRG